MELQAVLQLVRDSPGSLIKLDKQDGEERLVALAPAQDMPLSAPDALLKQNKLKGLKRLK